MWRKLIEKAFLNQRVCALFNQSLNIGRIPSEWKSANVTPIHKKDLRELAENYRPISLLPILGKVMERCICNKFYGHFKQLVTKLQHGFYEVARVTHSFFQF
jgi:hypothetical protein